MKKKISALLLSLALCAGLLAGCGTGETAEAPSDTDVQQVDSLKIAFSPYADADLISESTEPLEELLKAKLLEKGYDVGEIDPRPFSPRLPARPGRGNSCQMLPLSAAARPQMARIL